jgi:hypothetical protein
MISKVHSVSEASEVHDALITPTARTWAGNAFAVSPVTQAKHYLHLHAFPCGKCNGPVIVGSIGTKEDDISQEMEIGGIGAVCIACGWRPDTTIAPLAGHRFRPVEWKWPIQRRSVSEDLGDSLAAELSQDADR